MRRKGRIFVIAEAGVNHNGSLARARRMVKVAAEAGADAVKFQSFHADSLALPEAPKARYQVDTTGNTGSQFSMLKALELSEEAHRTLARECRAHRIEFLSTPFDPASADLLERLGVRRYKISSGDVTNSLLLRKVAAKGKPVILSTGMSTVEEVGAALRSLRKAGSRDVSLLHCVFDYPTLAKDVNLRVMESLRKRFDVPVGFSDHTQGISVAIAAAALGAVIIEKHFTLDRALPGPDHRASLEPGELRAMIRGIRDVEEALGDGRRRLTSGERATRTVARRSLVAATDLAAGQVIGPAHLEAKRPATGLSAMEIDRIVGRKLRVPINKGVLLTWGHLR